MFLFLCSAEVLLFEYYSSAMAVKFLQLRRSYILTKYPATFIAEKTELMFHTL